MESEVDSIDKKIEHLKKTIIEKYNESIKNIDKNIADAKLAAIEKVTLDRAALIKELDDRLTLVKQFPSVLEADHVSMQDLETDYSITIQYQGSFRRQPSGIYLDKGKWKVLILAKRIE